MKKAKKYVSAMLACAIGLLPAGITGCSKNIRDLFVKDSPWYSFRKFEVCDQYIKDQPVNSCFTLFAGADGDNLYFYTSGEYKVPDDADWENVDYADYRFANLDVYDKYGNLIKTIDLYHSIDFSSVAYEGQQISEIYYHPFCVNTIKDGKVGLKASAYMLPFELSKDIDLIYDVRSEKAVSLNRAPGEYDLGSNTGLSFTTEYVFEGYTVVPYESYGNGDVNKQYLYVVKPDGSSSMIDLSEQIPVSESQMIMNVIYTGHDKALVGIVKMLEPEYYQLDLQTGKLTTYKEDTSWFEHYLNQFVHKAVNTENT